MEHFLTNLLSYPVLVFSIPFSIFTVLMIIDLILNFTEVSLNSDSGDVDASWSVKLFLPPVIALVPLPITLCLSTFFGTVITYYLNDAYALQFDAWIMEALLIVVLLIIFYLSLYISAQCLRPLAPLLNRERAFATIKMQGRRAFIRSSTVSGQHGEAIVTDDGNEIQIDVYNDVNEIIHYGDEVLILSKNEETNRYLVSKLPQ